MYWYLGIAAIFSIFNLWGIHKYVSPDAPPVRSGALALLVAVVYSLLWPANILFAYFNWMNSFQSKDDLARETEKYNQLVLDVTRSVIYVLDKRAELEQNHEHGNDQSDQELD